MDSIIEFFIKHASVAHWFAFIAILLAGLCIPISIDLVVLVSAFLAATVIPENTLILFLSVFFGCYFSAWIAYWMGRTLGPKLASTRLFAKILHQERLEKVKNFYNKYGLFTLLVTRFIPFGVRNCVFMTSGMSKRHFGRFILEDLLACSVWTSLVFYFFFSIGQHYEILSKYLKTFNIVIFSAFSVTVIGIIWYKKRKRR